VFLVGLLLVVAAEIVSFVVVAEQIGFVWALTILLAVSVLGPFIVRRVGTGVMTHTQQRLARGEVPTEELLDGLVVFIGGVMICVPGFIGDAVGLLFMMRPVRRLVIRTTGHWLARRVQVLRLGPWRAMEARYRMDDDPALGPGPTSRPPEPPDPAQE